MAVFDWIHETLGIDHQAQLKILWSFLATGTLYLARKALLTIIYSRQKDENRRLEIRKSTRYTGVLLGLLILGHIWMEGFESVFTLLGLLGAGLAIALKDPVINIAGWFFIAWRHPFHLGDRISIDGHHGDVIDLRMFQFTLMEIGNWVEADQPTGRLLHIPNGRVFQMPQANYTEAFRHIWDELHFHVTFESNWQKLLEKTREILESETAEYLRDAEKQVNEARKKYVLMLSSLKPEVFTRIVDRGIQITMRYMVKPRRRRSIEQKIWLRVLETVNENADIEFAYPTTRFFDRNLEKNPENH